MGTKAELEYIDGILIVTYENGERFASNNRDTVITNIIKHCMHEIN